MSHELVIHIRDMQPGDVRIDRRTKWGNPFVLGKDGTREEVIRKYDAWMKQRIRDGDITQDEFLPLHGKRLACWCAPLDCHGDVLVAISKAAYQVKQK